MAPRKDLIAFVDLETSGNENIDEIIEVGVSVWSWPEWKEVYAKDIVVWPSVAGLQRLNENDVVREMHTKNGLLLDIGGDWGVPVERADDILDDDFLQFGSRGSSHIPLGGSGVLHFDRKYMIRDLPKFNSRLSYWALDVGVLRRMFMMAGAVPADDNGKTHRALDDARVHAGEFKFYMEKIQEMYGSLREAASMKSVRETPNVIID